MRRYRPVVVALVLLGLAGGADKASASVIIENEKLRVNCEKRHLQPRDFTADAPERLDYPHRATRSAYFFRTEGEEVVLEARVHVKRIRQYRHRRLYLIVTHGEPVTWAGCHG